MQMNIFGTNGIIYAHVNITNRNINLFVYFIEKNVKLHQVKF